MNLERLYEIQALHRRLPLNEHGHVVSPRYVRPGSPYLAAWRQWCKANPKQDWPKWLADDLKLMRKSSSVGQNSTAASAPFTTPTCPQSSPPDAE